MSSVPRLGAWVEAGTLHVRTWAPGRREVRLELESPVRRSLPMEREPLGLWHLALPDPGGDVRWRCVLDGEGPFPDPLSFRQPEGAHGPSSLDRAEHRWSDERWRGSELRDLVVWEAHVGAATPEGTFDALATKLPHLVETGVTALELMPVATFPGRRNWGYDGTFWCAPAEVYGGPAGLRRLVDAAHRAGLAVLLDVVLNHFGPEANWLWLYAREAFTDRHRTPWGEALDFGNPVLRELAFTCVERWVRDFHLDGLRLDATHAIFDDAPKPSFFRELAARARAAAPGRRALVIAEDDRNEACIVRPVEAGGDGLDAVWADDFHHALRRLLAGDADGYFADYEGTAREVCVAVERGWIYDGGYSAFRGAPRGTSPEGLPPTAFVHCLQNHDQVGNRALGDRLGASVDAATMRAATAVLLLSPHVPLLFMGQEWGATTPFQYFTDHPPELGRAVTEGRRREFEKFVSFAGEIPDPQSESTFHRSKLDWSEPVPPFASRSQPPLPSRERGRAGIDVGEGTHARRRGVRASATSAPHLPTPHATTLAWHRALLTLRRTHPALRDDAASATPIGDRALVLRRGDLAVLVSFGPFVSLALETPHALLLSSEEPRFGGDGLARLDTHRAVLEGPGALVLERR